MRLIPTLLAASATLLSSLTWGQAMLGHKYELEAAPIREGEKAVIPLDTEDPELQHVAPVARPQKRPQAGTGYHQYPEV